VELFAVFLGNRLGLIEHPVEFPDGVERMNVSRVAVIEFMLDETGEPVERRINRPSTPSSCISCRVGKTFPASWRIARKLILASGDAPDLPRQQGQAIPDQGREVEVRCRPSCWQWRNTRMRRTGSVPKNPGRGRRQFPSAQGEAVDQLRAFKPAQTQHLAEREQRTTVFLDRPARGRFSTIIEMR